MIFCKHLDKPLIFIQNICGDGIGSPYGKRSVWMCPICKKYVYRSSSFVQGEVSDGYHTFNELYHHRTLLFASLCNQNKSISWKSKKHSDGTMFTGMFIAGINTPEGQATYHCDIKYWYNFKVEEKQFAPEFDGHTSEDAIIRISNLFNEVNNK